MVASKSTIDQVRNVMFSHLTQQQADAIVSDLLKVKGNKSFTDTIKLLAKAIGH